MITENLIDSYVNQGATAFQQGQFQAAGKLFLAAYQKSRSLDKSDPKLAGRLRQSLSLLLSAKALSKSGELARAVACDTDGEWTFAVGFRRESAGATGEHLPGAE